MASSQKRIINSLQKLNKNRALITTGIVSGIGIGIYYLDVTNEKRFEKNMVKLLSIGNIYFLGRFRVYYTPYNKSQFDF